MKRLARSVARANSTTIARRSLAIPCVRGALVKQIGQLIRQELKCLCADKFTSVYRDTSKSALENFSLVSLFSELDEHAPILKAVLMESCPSNKTYDQKKLAVVVSASILLKFRNCKMKLVAAIFSLILQAGHAGQQV